MYFNLLLKYFFFSIFNLDYLLNNYFIINILKGNYLTNKLKIQMINIAKL